MKQKNQKAMRRRWAGIALAVAATTSSTAMLIATPGAAQASQGVGRFNNSATNRCLDSNEVGSAYTSNCDSNNPWLVWEENSTPLGAHRLRSTATNRCLDSNYAGQVYTTPCDSNNTYQNWVWFGEGGGHIRNLETNRCLDSNYDGQLYTLPCQNGNRFQDWA